MNCDPLARWYQTLEYLGMGRALERRRCEFLPLLKVGRPLRGHPCDLPEASAKPDSTPSQTQSGQASERPPYLEERALLLGDGDGRFLATLLVANLTFLADYVDGSAKMLALARARLVRCLGEQETTRRVRFFQADALHWQPPASSSYGLVVTHFFLDCFTDDEIQRLLSQLEPFIAPDAVWIVSEFHQPTHGFRAWRARLWIGGLYRAFGWLTGLRVRRLPDYPAALAAHGFHPQRRVVAELGLLVSEWWERSREDFAFDAASRATVDSPTPKS